MGTSCNIGYFDEDNGEYRYCHSGYDGYPGATGAELLENYPTLKDATRLVEGGNMGYPGNPYSALGDSWDRVKPKITCNISETLGEPFSYIFKKGKWMVSTKSGLFQDLRKHLGREE